MHDFLFEYNAARRNRHGRPTPAPTRLSSDLFPGDPYPIHIDATFVPLRPGLIINNPHRPLPAEQRKIFEANDWQIVEAAKPANDAPPPLCYRSEEHTSELQYLMRISYASFCLKKKITHCHHHNTHTHD